MNGNDEYYRQFCTPEVITLVKNYIGEKAIRNSKDPEFFNDIQLHHWDSMHPMIGRYVDHLLREANGPRPTHTPCPTPCA